MPKLRILRKQCGRGALYAGRRCGESRAGLHTSDYADMSNDKPGANPGRRNPKDSWGRFVHPGLVGPLGEAVRRS